MSWLNECCVMQEGIFRYTYLKLVDMQSYVQVNMGHSHYMYIAISQKKKKKKTLRANVTCYSKPTTLDVK